jgi:hypothetical protein
VNSWRPWYSLTIGTINIVIILGYLSSWAILDLIYVRTGQHLGALLTLGDLFLLSAPLLIWAVNWFVLGCMKTSTRAFVSFALASTGTAIIFGVLFIWAGAFHLSIGGRL